MSIETGKDPTKRTTYKTVTLSIVNQDPLFPYEDFSLTVTKLFVNGISIHEFNLVDSLGIIIYSPDNIYEYFETNELLNEGTYILGFYYPIEKIFYISSDAKSHSEIHTSYSIEAPIQFQITQSEGTTKLTLVVKNPYSVSEIYEFFEWALKLKDKEFQLIVGYLGVKKPPVTYESLDAFKSGLSNVVQTNPEVSYSKDDRAIVAWYDKNNQIQVASASIHGIVAITYPESRISQKPKPFIRLVRTIYLRTTTITIEPDQNHLDNKYLKEIAKKLIELGEDRGQKIIVPKLNNGVPSKSETTLGDIVDGEFSI